MKKLLHCGCVKELVRKMTSTSFDPIEAKYSLEQQQVLCFTFRKLQIFW